MQIYELTSSKKTLKEYDPNRAPVKPNFGTGVGPGVKPQMTVTPTVNSTPAPGPAATGNTVNKANPANPNIAAQTPYVQGRAGQGANPTRFAKYDPKTSSMANLSQGMRAMTTPMAEPETPAQAPGTYGQPTYNVPLAKVPTTNTMMPTNMSATGAPAAEPDVQVTPAASKSPLPPTPPPAKFDPLGSAVKAMVAHNANQSGVGWLNKDNHIPKVRQNAVTGAILVDGKPYDPKNPAHVDAYREWTYGHRGSERVETDKDGRVTIDGQPYNANDPKHVAAYKNKLNPTARSTVPATTTSPAAPQSNIPPAATTAPKPATAPPAAAVQELIKRGYSPQGAAAEIAKQKATPATPVPVNQAPISIGGQNIKPNDPLYSKIQKQLAQQKPAGVTESLTWSRSFDPSRTLLKKIKQL